MGGQGEQPQSSLISCVWIMPGMKLILVFYAKPLEKGKLD